MNLSQLIEDPTRVSLNKMSLLDVIICANREDISSSGVQYMGNLRTDHELIYCNLTKPTVKNPHIFRTCRNYKNFNFELFSHDLESLPFEHILYIEDINEKVTYFNNLLLTLFDKHAPLRTIRCSKPKAPWLTDNVRSMIKLRDIALLRFKQTKIPEHYSYYKNLRNLTNNAIKNEKKAFLNFRIRTNKTKTLWRDLSDLNIYSKKRNTEVPQNLSNVNEINDYFLNSTKMLNTGNIQETKAHYLNNLKINFENKFEFILTTNENVLKIIQSMTSDALGHDNINLTMLKYCCPFIIPFVTHIINCCLLNNTFQLL